MSAFNDVKVFMEACGQTTDQNNVEQSSLYHNLIVEEYSEYIQARNKNDEAEIIDACFDTIWVIVGYMLSKGWSIDEIWNEGALSNLRKIDPVTKKVQKRQDGKVLKPENWQPPDFNKFVKSDQ